MTVKKFFFSPESLKHKFEDIFQNTEQKVRVRKHIYVKKMSSTWTILSPRKNEQKMERWKEPETAAENFPEVQKDNLYIDRKDQEPSTLMRTHLRLGTSL